MPSPTVVSVAESKSPGIASTVVILSVWVYGTVLPVSGLLQNAECQRSWMTRLVRSPSALYQRVARASRTALSWMTNASAPEPQTSSGCGSDTLTSWKDPVQIVPAPTGLQTRKSGGGGLRSSGAGGAAEAPPASVIEPTMANPAASPSVRASLMFPLETGGSVHPPKPSGHPPAASHDISVHEPLQVNCPIAHRHSRRIDLAVAAVMAFAAAPPPV